MLQTYFLSMEETHNPCACIQSVRTSNENLKYCLTEQHAICHKCYTHCVSLTHLCISLPINYKQYSSLRKSYCLLTKGATFLKIKTDAPVRLAIERFAAVSGMPGQNMQLVDPSGNLFDSNTLQPGYVYLLNETYSLSPNLIATESPLPTQLMKLLEKTMMRLDNHCNDNVKYHSALFNINI